MTGSKSAVVVTTALAMFVACDSGSGTTGADGASHDATAVDASEDARSDAPDSSPRGDAPREECADRNQLRNLYFGDLHVHTNLSFDAYVQGTRLGPRDAYRFARGDEVLLAPLDETGRGTRSARIDRPLDFAAVTDHAEFLGETGICTTPDAEGYDSRTCDAFRVGGQLAVGATGTQLTLAAPRRAPDVCGDDGQRCREVAVTAWRAIRDAAEEAYDRSEACSFSTFVAYEYSAATGISTQHRNVIFRGSEVPEPISYLDATTRWELWDRLRAECTDAGTGCEVLAIPHNSNQSNGHAFLPEYPDDRDEREAAALRASLEPVAEVFQHKGDSECANGLAGIVGAPDELCGFEKTRDPPIEDCGDGTGSGGLIGFGCVSSRDFLRGALLTGLAEWERLGVNPFRVGMIGSTDTHAGTPGQVVEDLWLGHDSSVDADPGERLHMRGTFGGVRYNPGGLAAVWAVENSRPALFDAIARREVYGTSGPRIAVRFFGGWDLDPGLCSDPEMVRTAYGVGVPMGSVLPADAGTEAPVFLVSALRDPGSDARPGTQLQRVQIVKGWVDGGVLNYRVYEVAGAPDNGASVDTTTCVQSGSGSDSLCVVWTDPDFRADVPALYYARVVENPSCRWSAWLCNTLEPPLPDGCTDPDVPRAIQERAWTSPIWYEPPR